MSCKKMCELPLKCAEYLNTEAAKRCKGCDALRLPPDYAEQILTEIADAEAAELEKSLSSKILMAPKAKKVKL